MVIKWKHGAILSENLRRAFCLGFAMIFFFFDADFYDDYDFLL
jgi:hypothetical protein